MRSALAFPTSEVATAMSGDSIATSGSLVVSRSGVDIDVTVPFVDVLPDADRIFAGYAFSEPGQYSVKILGPDGNVRAAWPTL